MAVLSQTWREVVCEAVSGLGVEVREALGALGPGLDHLQGSVATSDLPGLPH